MTLERSGIYSSNLGIDYGFLGNRITGSIDVYRRINSNLLLSRPLVSDSGFGAINENVGKVQNDGIEFGLNTINLDTKSPAELNGRAPFFWPSS